MVYCLYAGSYSDRTLLGVFTAYELAAQREASWHQHQWELDSGTGVEERSWHCNLCDGEIEERVLNAHP